MLNRSYFLGLYSAFFIMLLGCGKSPSLAIDPRLQPYVSAFYSEALARGITQFPRELGSVTLVENVPRTEGEPSENIPKHLEPAGACQYPDNNVMVKRAFFETASRAKIEQLMFHELGHCVLGQGHMGTTKLAVVVRSNHILVFPADTSLMVSVFKGQVYSDYRKQYLDALFSNCAVDFNKAFKENYPWVRRRSRLSSLHGSPSDAAAPETPVWP